MLSKAFLMLAAGLFIGAAAYYDTDLRAVYAVLSAIFFLRFLAIIFGWRPRGD